MATEAKIFEELKGIKEDIKVIKNHLFDPDRFMTADEELHYKQAMKELKEGKTTSLEDLEKELGL
jgi:hypothetical protein